MGGGAKELSIQDGFEGMFIWESSSVFHVFVIMQKRIILLKMFSLFKGILSGFELLLR